MTNKHYFKKSSPVRFVITFLVLFLLFYYFNVFYFGITSKGNHYSAFLDEHLNYIKWLRWILLHSAAKVLNWLGYMSLVSNYELLAVGHSKIRLIYTCLGLGVMSFFAAFVMAYPKTLKSKIILLITGLLGIQVLNILRFILLALYWNRTKERIIDHHIIFDVFIYIVIAVTLYHWVNSKKNNPDAAN
ncbi:hypothetical protein FFF34_000205 [Inquilinus sp. KBS0705]|nr:hypothetical protein FFF34_000205 [Inquilinus sp. KBS0705]